VFHDNNENNNNFDDDDDDDDNEEEEEEEESGNDQKTVSGNEKGHGLSSKSFGARTLRRLGWRGPGHGLGPQEEGITEPVVLPVEKARRGIGFQRKRPKKQIEPAPIYRLSTLFDRVDNETLKPPFEEHDNENYATPRQRIWFLYGGLLQENRDPK